MSATRVQRIAVCGCCGGPRSYSSGKTCRSCYSKPNVRSAFLNQFAAQSLPFETERFELVEVKKPRLLKRAIPKEDRDIEIFFPANTYWQPGYQDPVVLREKELARAIRKQRLITARRAASERRVVLAYPYISIKRDDHADLLAVNKLVPAGLPGREDVCQEIMLALWERRITIEQLQANKADVRAFVRSFMRANMEDGGYAISLDEPKRDGRSWHDVLATPSDNETLTR